jgi:uroporphyrinogen decarboxylase
MYDIRLDNDIIQRIMSASRVTVETEIACLKKLGFDMITAHPLNVGKTEIKDAKSGRRGYIDEWRRKYYFVDGVKYYADGSLRTEDLDAIEWDPNIEQRYANIKEVLEKCDDDSMAIIGRVGGTFERALLAVGPALFFKYIYEKPNFIKKLLEKINKYWIEIGRREIELGVDAILITDDLAYRSGPYLSPEHMEQFIWPTLRARKVAFQEVPVILHTDGNIKPLLPLLVELVDGLHSLEPTAGIEIGEVKKRYGQELVLLGNIDCGALLSHGSPEKVREVVKRTIALAAPGGGYFLTTSNGVHRAVKLANLWAMCEARNTFGKYPINIKMSA